MRALSLFPAMPSSEPQGDLQFSQLQTGFIFAFKLMDLCEVFVDCRAGNIIHSFKKYLSNAYFIVDTVLHTGNDVV